MRRVSCRPVATALASILALLSTDACVPGGHLSTPTSPSAIIQTDEIRGSTATNAYDLVEQVRPNWLTGRGVANLRGTAALPVVYIANIRQGPVDVLRGIATSSIVELRFIDATTATTLYGDGHSGGVIQVVLRDR